MTQTLEQLSAAATQGEWMVDSVNGFIFTRPDPLTRYVIAEMQSSVTENEVFIVALVNAYRTGQLVAVADDAMVERVARAIMIARDNGGCIVKDWHTEARDNPHVEQAVRQAKAAIAAMKDTQP